MLDTLTSRYLERVRGIPGSELIGSLPQSELLNGLYHGRYLSRPVFLDHGERARLHADLENLRGALVSLPGRLFGGDVGAFASAMGMTGYQREAIEREVRARLGRGIAASQLTRVDMYRGTTGFQVLEFNMGSAVGGLDNPDICRALLQHPVLAAFAAENGLGFTDTTSGMIDTIFTETGLERGSFPVVALANWPGLHMDTYMRHVTQRWRGLGLDAHPCHVGELSVRCGGVWLDGRRVDVIYRMFATAELRKPGASALMTPLLDAAERGDVVLFTPLASEMLGSKAALAMVSGDRNGHLFSAAERASIAAIVPWTRLIRPEDTILPDGASGDLVRYVIEHQADLVLKPAMLHAGLGVLLGWHPDTTPRLWRDRVLAAAAAGDHVVQRGIRPVPELFPGDDGQPVPWIVLWGAFTAASATGGTGSVHGGLYTRAVRADGQTKLITRDSGAFVGCCLVAERA
ncbi:MAG TPA: hypothetical protein VKS82_17650 [Streptosporangiaceae bacterium]|nr:hypothetical protein [Streptosporangiaceae bacterium]